MDRKAQIVLALTAAAISTPTAIALAYKLGKRVERIEINELMQNMLDMSKSTTETLKSTN